MNVTESLDYERLAGALVNKLKGQGDGSIHNRSVTNKAAGSTPNATYAHGPGGLFSYPGLNQQLFSAMLLPSAGLQSRLPLSRSNEANPLFGLITGVTDTTGDEPTNVCDDPPYAGLAKLCTTSYVFGRYSRKTRIYDIDRAGLITNRGEFTDLVLNNNPLTDAARYNIPSMPGGFNPNEVVKIEVGKALFELGTAWSRDFAQQLYIGNPTNNTAGGGYQEFRGLDNLINTGYRDAITGQACAAADSLVMSFGNADVATNGLTMVNTIIYMMRNLKYIASRTGLSPVKFAIAMPWALFYEIANFWACSYMTIRCQTANMGGSSTQFVDAREVVQFRDTMLGDLSDYTGQFLPIDGERIEVVIDDAIVETDNGGGTFTSSIYIVPLTVKGRIPVTYMDYLAYDIPGGALDMARTFAGQVGGNPYAYQATDDGRFLWHFKPPTNFCVEMLAKSQPRLILRTPYIAGRITNVRYTPFMHQRSWNPDAGASLYSNGGRTDYVGYGPSFYSPTA